MTLLNFIQEVAAAGFPWEAVDMLTGAASQKLIYLLKSVQKNPQTAQWMREMDDAHVSTWLHCLTASTDLEYAIGPSARDQLSGLIDLPPTFGGIGLQSLERSAERSYWTPLRGYPPPSSHSIGSPNFRYISPSRKLSRAWMIFKTS